jgi:putative acetyltransferase
MVVDAPIDRRQVWEEVRALVVRSETPGDHAAIRRVHDAAFGRESEGRLVDALRQDGLFSPDMSLVGVAPGGEVVGHVLHSTVDLEVDGVAVRGAALAPLGVLPAHQRTGVGTKLVREGLHRLRLLGYRAVIVVGDPAYYARFGFSRELAVTIASPYVGEAHQALELEVGALAGATSGRVAYPPPFTEV